MSWEELAQLAADPLVTIGAHTVNHVMLAKAPERGALRDGMSRSVIEASLGVRPDHLSYPVGDRTSAGPREFRIAAELGFKTAVTTRPGVLFSEHSRHLTALPRISLNGEYPAAALCARAALGRGNRDVERLPPGRRGLSPDSRSLRHPRMSGIAGSTQPSPATT